MLIDLHNHECTFSPDSHQKLDDMVREAKRIGLDGLAITDHDSMGLKDFAEEYSKKVAFPIFVGVEYYSLQGDIVAFGITDFPRERIPAQDFIDEVYRRGGVTIACHPFRNNNRGLEKHLATIQHLTGVEVRNGSTSPEANALADRYCQERGFQRIGSSDSHLVERLGIYATRLEGEFSTIPELVKVLKEGKTEPVVLKDRYQFHDPGFDCPDPEYPGRE